jgi:TolA-binding protein
MTATIEATPNVGTAPRTARCNPLADAVLALNHQIEERRTTVQSLRSKLDHQEQRLRQMQARRDEMLDRAARRAVAHLDMADEDRSIAVCFRTLDEAIERTTQFLNDLRAERDHERSQTKPDTIDPDILAGPCGGIPADFVDQDHDGLS